MLQVWLGDATGDNPSGAERPRSYGIADAAQDRPPELPESRGGRVA
jgi:hypothetical protein